MKFIVNSSELSNSLSFIKNVINSKNTMPILDDYLVEVNQNGKLSITATDLETRITAHNTASDVDESFSVCINAKRVNDILSMFKEQPLEFSIKDNTLTIKSNVGKYKLPVESSEEYTRIPSIDNSISFSIDGKDLSNGINTTLFATSSDNTRPIFTCIHIDSEDNHLRFTATDSHKLSRFTKTMNDNNTIPSFSCNIAAKPSALIQKIADKTDSFSMTVDDKFILLSSDTYTIISRQIEGNFPNCDRVIPAQFSKVFNVNRNTLLDSIKRVSYFSNAKSNMATLNIKDNIINISAQDFDYNTSAIEQVEINPSTTPCNEEINIGFKSSFLMEVIDKIYAPQLNICLNSSQTPAIFSFEEEQGVKTTLLLMPMALN